MKTENNKEEVFDSQMETYIKERKAGILKNDKTLKTYARMLTALWIAFLFLVYAGKQTDIPMYSYAALIAFCAIIWISVLVYKKNQSLIRKNF